MTTQTDLTVRKSVLVNCSPEVAFHVFTERKTDWWPYETHAASGEKESLGNAVPFDRRAPVGGASRMESAGH